MFSGCNSCGTTGIDVAVNRAVSFFNCTEGFINTSTGVNTKALNARVYVGDITLTFNRPVSNPVLQLSGMGGTSTITRSGKIYDMGFSNEFDLSGTGVTLRKLAGNAYLNVSATQITNSATWLGSSSQGTASNGVTRYAASGSVMVVGTNITTVTLKAYIRGDGGRVSNGTTAVTPDAGFTPQWAFGATNPFGVAGIVSGDLMSVGVSLKKPVTVTGTVFNDHDGGNVNYGLAGSNAIPAGMYAHLKDAAGKVVASTTVNINGTYSFAAVFEGDYTVQLGVAAASQGVTAPAAATPSGWYVTGEFNGTPNTGNDGTANGVSATFTVAASAVNNINFGIERPSVAASQSYTIAQPAFNSSMSLNGNGLIAAPAPLKAVDPEEGNLEAGKKFSVTVGTAMNGNKLFYNGVEVTGTLVITNYDPSLLAVKFTGSGSVELQFTFESYDAAGKISNTAVYHMMWITVLPVRVFEAAVTVNNTAATINWKTENEVNTSRFYVERSTDNNTFVTVANTAAAGNSTTAKNYSVKDDIAAITGTLIYYRIKLVDANGKNTYSNTVTVRVAGVNSINVFPNPFTEKISISFYSNSNTTAVIRLTDMNGKTVAQSACTVVKGNNQQSISNLKNIAGGMYLLHITGANNNFNIVQKIVK
jgi:Secretion system C-terminal sorting domain